MTKAAESRHNNPSPRREQSERGYGDQQYYSSNTPIESSGRGQNTSQNAYPRADARYLPSRDMQDRGGGQYQDFSYNNNNNEPRQRAYIEGPAPPYSESQRYYYTQDPYERRPQPEYEYAGESRSPRPAYQQYENGPSRRQYGFVEPEEIGDDSRGVQQSGGGGGARGGGQGGSMDGMMGMLAQHAMGMGLMGREGGRGKDKGDRGDLMKSLLNR